ncbi:hypothetical protein GH714_038593 [Hevea brasiliensis]|uniref:PGG domain-containing protein n=1 Tax=Hevea brasiliensis TaxID=3981 RepID=A0A6A6N9Q7_HEVBR|nr:hypothetical protein GH714_038593 [Hevea brasiliensis]
MSMDQRLTEAAQAGDVDALYALIREDACVLERVDVVPFVDSPLHIAASAGHIHFAMEIVNLKASFTRKLNPDGFSPMHCALQNKDMLMVKWLIDVDGNLVRVKGKGGCTPLHYAAEQGNLSILRECYKGCPESIKDVTFQGDTALHVAVKNHQKDAFEFLLMEWLRQSEFEDADFWEREILNWKNEEGKTVLHIAASENGWNDQHQVLEMLLRCHARTDIKDHNGLTAEEILKGQVRLTEREIWNMQAAGAGILFPLMLLYRSLTCPRHSVLPKAQKSRSKSRSLLWKLRRRSLRKSCDRRNIELLVDTLILTAMYQASLSPPGGLWQGNSNKDFVWHGHVSATMPTSPSPFPAPPRHYAGKSVMTTDALLVFYIFYAGLFLLTALRTMANLINDGSGLSFTIFLSVG